MTRLVRGSAVGLPRVCGARLQSDPLSPPMIDPRLADPVCAALPPRAASTKTDSKPETDTTVLTARPWNVIVHDDPVSLMGYVTKVFMDVFRYSQPKAHRLMMEVHTAGKSVVWTGPREQAETYVTKLQAFHLLATVEPSGD